MIDLLQEICILPDTPLLQAMRIIDQCGAQIAMVVDTQNMLLGTLTDGDIRRGLLQGETLEAPVERLMNRKFRSVSTSEDEAKVQELMKRQLISQLPVLDQQGRVVDLMLLHELIKPPHLTNPVVIMAGGMGTRLRPHTQSCPKPMLPVRGKPILEILLEQCIACGFRQFYLSVNYLKDQIIDYFGDGSHLGVTINYLAEEKPLGTAGSLQLLPKSISEPFLVLNGDVLTRLKPSRLLQFHCTHDAYATLCVREHSVSIPYGVVEVNGVDLASFNEKPTYSHLVNAGVYVINPSLLPLLSSSAATDMPSFLQIAQDTGYRVAVCPIHEYWIDVGNPEALDLATKTWQIE